MATYVRNVRKYWKRYLLGVGVFYFASRSIIKRYRNTVITRQICSEICGRAKETHPATENVKKAYVFFNPTADNGNARGNFEKFALPILNLAEFEVILIESEYGGQIRTLMGYIDPKTDIVVAAGGDGTLFEMINGLMRRYDVVGNSLTFNFFQSINCRRHLSIQLDLGLFHWERRTTFLSNAFQIKLGSSQQGLLEKK